MKTTVLPLSIVTAIAAGTLMAAWDDSYAPMGESSPYTQEEVLLYDEPLGVDPIYTTPNASTSTFGGQRPFVPDEFYIEYLGKMSVSGHSARTQVTNAYLSLPLTDPRRMTWGRWHLDTRASARITWINTDGRDVIDEDVLYTIGIRATLVYQASGGSSFQLGFTPQLSTDFDVMSAQNFYWGGYVAYSGKSTERLRYTLGLAVMPDYYENYVFPVVNVSWRYAPSWELRLQSARLSAVNLVNERFEWGPFFQWNSGIWTVHRHQRTEQLRMTNCILGVGMTYDMLGRGDDKVLFIGDLGCSFYNTFRIRDKHGDHTLEKYRAHPGLYLRAGLQFKF